MDYYGIPRWRLSLGFGMHIHYVFFLIESFCWGITKFEKDWHIKHSEKEKELTKISCNFQTTSMLALQYTCSLRPWSWLRKYYSIVCMYIGRWDLLLPG